MRRWTPEEVAEVRRLAAEGLDAPAIAPLIGRTPNAIWCSSTKFQLGLEPTNTRMRRLNADRAHQQHAGRQKRPGRTR